MNLFKEQFGDFCQSTMDHPNFEYVLNILKRKLCVETNYEQFMPRLNITPNYLLFQQKSQIHDIGQFPNPFRCVGFRFKNSANLRDSTKVYLTGLSLGINALNILPNQVVAIELCRLNNDVQWLCEMRMSSIMNKFGYASFGLELVLNPLNSYQLNLYDIGPINSNSYWVHYDQPETTHMEYDKDRTYQAIPAKFTYETNGYWPTSSHKFDGSIIEGLTFAIDVPWTPEFNPSD